MVNFIHVMKWVNPVRAYTLNIYYFFKQPGQDGKHVTVLGLDATVKVIPKSPLLL